MARKSLSENAQAAAEAAAAADAELLASLQNRDGEVEAPAPEPVDNDPETTIADKAVGLAQLAVRIRRDLRLSESLIGKIMETSLQWHAWDYQRRAAERQANPFAGFMGNTGESSNQGDDGLVGPDVHEVIGPADDQTPDNVVSINGTQE